jgi:uncharacterized protein involved in outer membrane biogenesis
MMGKLSGIYRSRIKPRAKKIVIGVFVFFALFTLLGFFAVPPLLKSILVKQLSENLHRDVAIKQISFNPYTLSVATRGLTVKDRGSSETFLSCDEIFLNLETFSALRLALVLKEVRFNKPYLKITRNQDLSYNFSDLLEEKKPAPAKKEKPNPLRFSLNNIVIDDGSIDFFDGPKQTKHTVRELKIGIPFLSNVPSDVERFVQPHFSAKINDALYSLQGKTKPFADSLETSFDIDIKDLDIPDYLAYFPIKMNFKIVSAYLDTQAKVVFVETKKNKPSLTVTGTASLRNVALADEKDKRFFTLPVLSVMIAPSEPLARRIHLSKVSIESPEFEIVRDKKGVVNFQALLPEEGKESPPTSVPKGTESTSPFSLDIDEIQMTAGKVSFSDFSRSKPFGTVLDPIEAKVDRFSNGKDKKGAYSLTFKTEAKETVKVEGAFSLDPLGSEGVLQILAVPLKKYSPFYRENVLFEIEEGRLDFATRYTYAKGEKEPQVTLSGLSTMVNALRLRKTGENDDFAKIPGFMVKETELDLAKKEIKIGSLSTEKGEIYVKRLRNGDLDLLSLLPQEAATAGLPKKQEAADNPKEPGKPWVVSLRQILVDSYTVQVEDQTTRAPTSLLVQKLRLKGENLSTAKNSKGKVASSLLLNGKGTISAAGTVGIEPLSADLRMELKGIEIAPFQPYFARKVRATVTGGAISMAGRLSFASTEKKEMKVSYTGEASLTGFSAIDRLNGNDLLRLGSLSLTDMDVGYSPLSVSIKGVSLSDFYALVLVDPEGKINLQEIMTVDSSKAETAPIAAPQGKGGQPAATEDISPKKIKIDQVTLQAGKLDFVDKSVKPEFSTKLSEMTGRVSGLSAEANTTADVQVLAKLNDYAPLEITGKINPLREDLFVDLKARIKDLDLSSVSPYSGKYAGYTIEKGKLSFEAQYSVNKRKLDSRNNVFIDQFTFGEKVESPQATKLPVRLAIALLKDRKGEIKLDLPVSGSLDDPKFSVWKIVLQVIVNLITKAATSPFALLGAMFGGGEELSYVEFDYGSTVITEPSTKKLDTVVKALHERPSLSIEIEGHADKERDTDGLRQLLFQRKIKTQKLNEMAKKGQPVPPVDEVKVEPTEYEKYLKAAYRQERFPKPKNVLGLAKDIPALEMEKLMLTHIEVKEGDLRTLASQRAMKVKDAILKSNQVDPQKVFILEPKSLAPEKKAKMRDSRVDFKLK